MIPQVNHLFTISAVFVLFLLSPSSSQVEVTQLESHTGAILQDGHFPLKNVGYVVGDMDSILKTEDQGASWTKIPVGLEPAFTGVWFLDDTTGFIVGDSAVYQTQDGGGTWKDVFSHPQGRFNRIAFYNDRMGLLTIRRSLPNESSVFYTEDGGATWEPSNLDSGTVTGVEPGRIQFASSTVAYIAARTCLLISEDTGKNWRVKEPMPNGSFIYSLSFYSPNNGIIGSPYYGGIWAVDSGKSLKEVWRPEQVTAVRMISEDQLLALSDNGEILTAVNVNGEVDTLWMISNPQHDPSPLQSFVHIEPGVDFLIGREGRIFKARYDQTLGIRTGKISPRRSREGIVFSQKNRFLLNREQDGKLRSYLINGALLPEMGTYMNQESTYEGEIRK